jgi:flavin-binding protein dodecin
MNTIKVIEVLAESDSSWEDAAQVAVNAVSGSIHNLRSLHVSELEAVVDGDKIARYRINAKVSFLVDH